MRREHLQIILISGLILGLHFPLVEAFGQTRPAQTSSTQSEENALANYPRLNQIVDYRCEKVEISEVLRDLSERCLFKYKVTFQPHAEEDVAITLHFTQQPLKSVLASLPLLFNRKAVWKREGETLILSLAPSSELNYYRPHTQAEAQAQAQGRAFLDSAAKLPLDLQRRLGQGASGKVSLGELPQEMQQTLQRLYHADAQVQTEKKHASVSSDPPRKEDPAGCTVSFSPAAELSDAVQSYDVDFRFGAESKGFDRDVSIRITRFVDDKEDYHLVSDTQVEAENKDNRIAQYKALRESRKQALEKEARIAQRVTLTLDRVTLTQAIQNIARSANISTAAEYLTTNEKHSFSFKNLPLKDALDQIVAAYAYKDSAAPQTPKEIRGEDGAAIGSVRFANGTAMPAPKDAMIYFGWGWQPLGTFIFREYTSEDRKATELPSDEKP